MYDIKVAVAAVCIAFTLDFFVPGYATAFAMICAALGVIIGQRFRPSEKRPTQA